MRLVLLIIILSSISMDSAAQLPDFYREYITLELSADYLEVNGVYQFRNTENRTIELNLFYPFPEDSTYGSINNIYAFETKGDSTLNRLLKTNNKGGVVRLIINPRSEKTYYIGYTQQFFGNKAEYILTTTKKWGKPLESSQIELIVPLDFIVDDISYQATDTIISEGKTHYFIRKINFMPEKNFVVRFRK